MLKMFGGVLLATWVATGGSVNAEPGPIGKWLMATPVTLWDRGMDAMEQEAKSLYGLEPESWLPSGMKILGAWVSYFWDNNEITIHAWFPDTHEVFIDHEWCNTIRARVISRITGFPPGVVEREMPDGSSFAISDVIDGWFSHDGFQRPDRDDELGAKMARIIFVSVEITSEDGSGIRCRDRITSLDAPSKPHNRGN